MSNEDERTEDSPNGKGTANWPASATRPSPQRSTSFPMRPICTPMPTMLLATKIVAARADDPCAAQREAVRREDAAVRGRIAEVSALPIGEQRVRVVEAPAAQRVDVLLHHHGLRAGRNRTVARRRCGSEGCQRAQTSSLR